MQGAFCNHRRTSSVRTILDAFHSDVWSHWTTMMRHLRLGSGGLLCRGSEEQRKRKLHCRGGRRLEVGLPAGIGLLVHRIIRPALENLRGQVPVLLITKWACDHEGVKRKFLHPDWHIQAASFALNDELLSFLNSKAHHVSFEHTRAVPHSREQF